MYLMQLRGKLIPVSRLDLANADRFYFKQFAAYFTMIGLDRQLIVSWEGCNRWQCFL